MPDDDVPSPIDFHDPVQARAWVQDTIRRRPYRPRFFAAFASALNERFDKPLDILELGSGPDICPKSFCNAVQSRLTLRWIFPKLCS